LKGVELPVGETSDGGGRLLISYDFCGRWREGGKIYAAEGQGRKRTSSKKGRKEKKPGSFSLRGGEVEFGKPEKGNGREGKLCGLQLRGGSATTERDSILAIGTGKGQPVSKNPIQPKVLKSGAIRALGLTTHLFPQGRPLQKRAQGKKELVGDGGGSGLHLIRPP